jgi:hypothetical protein
MYRIYLSPVKVIRSPRALLFAARTSQGTSNRAEFKMAINQFWLTVPHAVVLEATRNIELVSKLTEDDPELLVIKANQLIAPRMMIPLEADADEERRANAFKNFHEQKAILQKDNSYLQAQQRVRKRLLEGVTVQAARMPNGPRETVDPLELTRVELYGVHAVDKGTRAISLYDLRIHGFAFVESLTGKPIAITITSSPGDLLRIDKDVSQARKKWDCSGDPIPELIEWALSQWGNDLQKLPNRSELLRIFREQYGRVLGINEHTMREVRRQLASKEARRGGAPTHRR